MLPEIFLKYGNPLSTQTAINLSMPLIMNNQIGIGNNFLEFTNIIKKMNDKNKKFFDICNKIAGEVFDYFNLDIIINSYDVTYTFKSGPIKITLKAKAGGNFSYGKEQYIFKNSEYCETEGFLLKTLDIICKNNNFFVPQIRRNIEIFKQKVGESMINGSVEIKIEFNKLIYEFKVAKNDDLNELYGTLIVTLELDIDFKKIGEKIYEKISNAFFSIKNLSLSAEQKILIGAIVLGLAIISNDVAFYESLL